MLILKIYSIFVVVAFLMGVINKSEDRAVRMTAFIIFAPVLISLIYGGVC